MDNTDGNKPEIKQDTFPRYRPRLSDFPDYLKDPANYEKIQRALLDTLASSHSHSEVLEWYSCKKCAKKLDEHTLLMKTLGFKTSGHYYAWKKIMHEIHKKYPNVDWTYVDKLKT